MKTLQSLFLAFILVGFSSVAVAQNTKRDTLNVAGVCGMCKKKIETAATGAGAQFASWSPDTKKLVIAYDPAISNSVKIQQAIAASGYDTPEVKATDAAYTNLHECCRYDRSAAAKTSSVKTDDCCTNGSCGKEAGCCTSDVCCKDGTCCKKAEAGACCKPGADCCKDGKCTKHAAKKA